MIELKQDALEAAQKKVLGIQSGIEALKDLPDLQDVFKMHISDLNGSIYMCTPYNLDIYRNNRRTLFENGWAIVATYHVSNGNRYTELKNGKYEITYIMVPTHIDSTCERIAIGEETVTLYKTVCQKERYG